LPPGWESAPTIKWVRANAWGLRAEKAIATPVPS